MIVGELVRQNVCGLCSGDHPDTDCPRARTVDAELRRPVPRKKPPEHQLKPPYRRRGRTPDK